MTHCQLLFLSDLLLRTWYTGSWLKECYGVEVGEKILLFAKLMFPSKTLIVA